MGTEHAQSTGLSVGLGLARPFEAPNPNQPPPDLVEQFVEHFRASFLRYLNQCCDSLIVHATYLLTLEDNQQILENIRRINEARARGASQINGEWGVTEAKRLIAAEWRRHVSSSAPSQAVNFLPSPAKQLALCSLIDGLPIRSAAFKFNGGQFHLVADGNRRHFTFRKVETYWLKLFLQTIIAGKERDDVPPVVPYEELETTKRRSGQIQKSCSSPRLRKLMNRINFRITQKLGSPISGAWFESESGHGYKLNSGIEWRIESSAKRQARRSPPGAVAVDPHIMEETVLDSSNVRFDID